MTASSDGRLTNVYCRRTRILADVGVVGVAGVAGGAGVVGVVGVIGGVACVTAIGDAN